MALLKTSWIAERTQELLKDVTTLSDPAETSWQILEELDTAHWLARVHGGLYRLVGLETIGSGFALGLLGAHYVQDCLDRPWPVALHSLLAAERTRGRFHLLSLRTAEPAHPPFPLATLMEDYRGDYHAIEVRFPESKGLWALFAMAVQHLAESAKDPARLDDYGDFQILGAPSVVQRHSTERLRKHISQRVLYDQRLCNQCLRCVTACSEMQALVTEQGARLLGPSEDYCTNCGLCQKRCALLQARPKEQLSCPHESRWRIHEGGRGVHLYGGLALNFRVALESLQNADPPWFPYAIRTSLSVPDHRLDSYPVAQQLELRLRGGEGAAAYRPLLVTHGNGEGPESAAAVIRSRCRAALVLQTPSGEIERDMANAALRLGMDVTAVTDWGSADAAGDMLSTNQAARLLHETGHFLQESLVELWDRREVDLFLAPYSERVPLSLQQRILEETGRQAQVLGPHIFQALPLTTSPLLGRLNEELQAIFGKYPELLATEAKYARELLQDIPRNQALLHARYRSMAVASGHTACPTCAEVQVLALPAYMAIAMSLARGETPRVSLTMETGCMSETLNKSNEVAQKVPGGRTVFGGGFAFGEAMTMAQDRSIRRGDLPKGRRYVVSQGGDGGAVIGLPAWLNALRQQAALIPQRHPNVLHFINITDTQVYSNTGGESSATSLLGMGTLTTPIGKFLMGNQNVQWTLINLAAEFPGILVGAGHSANKIAMQQFWHLADRLGQSAIRWDVTPCPETGKFFGEDPDDLADVMAHAGMLPEVVFVGRFRKRVGPYHPEDRGKPLEDWRPTPKPVLYWLERDPRYRALLGKNPQTGQVEPRNLLAHFLITQLESFRDQMNWQIDLETRLVHKAEQWVRTFLDEIQSSRRHYRYRLERFRHAALFNQDGEWKPQYAVSLEHEMVRRTLGWDELQRYTASRDQMLENQRGHLTPYLQAVGELEPLLEPVVADLDDQGGGFRDVLERVRTLQQNLQQETHKLEKHLAALVEADPVGEELFSTREAAAQAPAEWRSQRLNELLDRILEERALAEYAELQQHRLAQRLKAEFLQTGGLIRAQHAVASAQGRVALRRQVAAFGPFSIGVASLAGDRGIAINRIFANFFTAKGAWAGMAWQFGSSKRGTPVLSATFVDARPLQRKDAMHSFPMAVLTVTNFEEMKRQPDLFFGQLHPGGFLIINQGKPAETLWQEVVDQYPADVGQIVTELREGLREGKGAAFASIAGAGGDAQSATANADSTAAIREEIALRHWGKAASRLSPEQQHLADKMTAMVCARVISLDMDGIMREVTGSATVVSNLVAVGPMFQALQAMGFAFDWEPDLKILTQGFPEAVLKNKKLLNQYYQAMERAKERSGIAASLDAGLKTQETEPKTQDLGLRTPDARSKSEEGLLSSDPGEYLMIMGGTLAGMVLSQVALPEHPLFYVGFPITPAGNPFYAMAEAYANGHPHIVVDEVNPSEKVAAEKLIGIARNGGFLPVTFTASQGWRLFTEIFPQFVGARLEGLFLITKRALAAPNLNIEESHTDFMSFRDDGGIMLAPKGIQEYVATLYLARLLTHFAKLPVVVSIGGITDTHKIGLIKVPADDRVRTWLRKTLEGFDFLEHKLINRQGDVVVHGPSGTSAVYQETQSEIEKAHLAMTRIYPYALRAVHELTGVWIDELEVQYQGEGETRRGGDTARGRGGDAETLLILQGSLYPNAVEAMRELEETGWTGMGCLSVRCFNPFPEDQLAPWLERAERIVVMDRSSSFGSIPPLASRIFTTFARYSAVNGSAGPKSLRTLVGGLGGREITVEEMKAILLSTHLLFHVPQPWEAPLITQWLDEDEILRTLMAEAAALDLRNTNRHTRVPRHLRSNAAEQEEYRDYLERLRQLLIHKDYPAFLANYHQVEFIAPREVLRETALLQQIVVRLEVRLARHALASAQSTWRHPLLLLEYSQAPDDHELAAAALPQGLTEGRIKPQLLQHYGVNAPIGEPKPEVGSLGLEVGIPGPGAGELGTEGDAVLESPGAAPSDPGASDPPVAFDESEAGRIEAILCGLVKLQGEAPLFFNPEDYEHEVLRRLQGIPGSPLFGLRDRHTATEADQLLWNYQCCYRDVIDRTLQREVLTQHHAPELKELFAGEGLSRLETLASHCLAELSEESRDQQQVAIQAELERYLTDRCFPGFRQSPLFYLEYFRAWVAPELIQEVMTQQGGN